MNQQPDKEGCLQTILYMMVILLLMYMAIDLWADRREEYHIRNLQRRVGQLEQQCK